LKIKLGYEHVKAVQQYEAMALVVSQAFGGETKNSEGNPQSFSQAQSDFMSVFGKK
jgi:hypothetical protein